MSHESYVRVSSQRIEDMRKRLGKKPLTDATQATVPALVLASILDELTALRSRDDARRRA